MRAVNMSTWAPGAGGGGGGSSIGATRSSIASGKPIQRSRLNGRAMRSAMYRPTDTPVTRRITSPASHP